MRVACEQVYSAGKILRRFPSENPMPLPLIYHDDYSPEFPADHRFPMDKFRLLRDHLVDSGLTEDRQLLRP